MSGKDASSGLEDKASLQPSSLKRGLYLGVQVGGITLYIRRMLSSSG